MTTRRAIAELRRALREQRLHRVDEQLDTDVEEGLRRQVERARLGGIARARVLGKRACTDIAVKGAAARNAALSPSRRSELARKAALSRWKRSPA